MIYENIVEAFKRTGLSVRGGFHVTESDALKGFKSIVMIGNAGPDMWLRFKSDIAETQRAADKNPLDQWTKKIVIEKADNLQAKAIFPFQGPPYYPFQQWAMKSENLFASPIGMLIHPDYGLWHAYRAALGFNKQINIPRIKKQNNPCENCTDKPCLSTCPVKAFDQYGYNDNACAVYLKTNEGGKSCMQHSCQARLACPVGRDYHYSRGHGRFHMNKFLGNR